MSFIGSVLNSYQKFFNTKIQKHRVNRNILLYCASDTMASHILNYYAQVKNRTGYRFFLYYGNSDTDNGLRIEKTREICKDSSIKPITDKFSLVCTHWDLIVTADLDYEPLRYSKDVVPIMYVNHGSHIVSVDKEGTLYAYGTRSLDKDGNCKFSAICEPNLRISEELNKSPQFKNCVFHVGSKDADVINSEMNNYNIYRRKLGVEDNITLVAVFGTWRKESLFQYLGNEFLCELGKISGKEYKFILSVHPREYTRYDDNIEPVGPLIDEFSNKYDFIVRYPGDSYIPYLIASDIVICDYSSLYENAIVAKKKLLFSYFPDYSVGNLSIAYKLKKEIKVIKKEDIPNLYSILEEVKSTNLCEYINQYSLELYSGKNIYADRINNITKKLLGIKGDSID